MPASPRALFIAILLTLRVADAFTSNGIFEAQAGLPMIGRRPPPSGSWTCVVGMSSRPANQGCGRNDARAKARVCLEMQARRANGQADSNNNGDEPASASSSRKVTQIDDGSPLGVAIVLLGGSWVVLGGGGDGCASSAHISSLPPLLASFVSSMDGLVGGGVAGGGGASGSTDGRIWAVFITASMAAGISRLVRYHWNEK